MPSRSPEEPSPPHRRIPSRPLRPAAPPPADAEPAPAPAPAATPAAEGAETGERWTVLKLLTWTADFLRRKGSESPRLDAEVLLAHVLGWPRISLYTHFEDLVSESDRGKYRELIRRRAEGAPVAYLVGRKEFYSLTLQVSPAVLIPRPDTETLVAEFLSQFKGQHAPRVADIGTGSGAIALACASQHRTAQLIAVDRSPEALAVARSNAETLGLTDRVEFREGDLLEPLAGDSPFDAILSNPPYIPTDDIAGLEPGVRDFEPHLALDGGADGLEVVARLIAGAPARLVPGGQLILEIGSPQEDAVRELIAARPEFDLMPTIRDAANHPRVIRAVRRP